MKMPAVPTLEDVSKRNPAIVPERVREMQRLVKQLQDLGVLIAPRYDIRPALGGTTDNPMVHQSIRAANDLG